MALATISAVLFLFVFLWICSGCTRTRTWGSCSFSSCRRFFVLGLLLIPLGVFLERRRRSQGLQPHQLPQHRFQQSASPPRGARHHSLTLVNVLIVALAATKGIEFMDSPQFCGQVCHTVMEPEFMAYQDGPHSRVRCVDCHIGPGASWFVKSKLDGTRQVIAVMRTAIRADPIAGPQPAPGARHLRAVPLAGKVPRRQGERHPRIRQRREEHRVGDALMVHVGGGSERLGVASGIHWHMNVANGIEYVTTDDKRQTIPYVKMKDPQGDVREFRTPDVTDDQSPRGSSGGWTAWTATTGRAIHSRPRRTGRGRGDRARRDPARPAVRAA